MTEVHLHRAQCRREMPNVVEPEVDRFEKYEQQEMYMKASTLLVTLCQTYSCIAVATTIMDTSRGLERTVLGYVHTGNA